MSALSILPTLAALALVGPAPNNQGMAAVEVHLVRAPEHLPVSAKVIVQRIAGYKDSEGPTEMAVDAPRGRASLRLGPGVWSLSGAGEGVWGWPVRVMVGPEGPEASPITLEVWDVGRVTGRLRVATADVPPRQIRVVPRRRLEPGATIPKQAEDTRVSCPVEGQQWTCELPVGELDLELDVRPYMPRYLWGVMVRKDKAADVGDVALVRGASVAGWVVDGDHRLVVAPATVELTSRGGVPISTSGADTPKFGTQTDKRGFFQIGPVPPAAYDLLARQGVQASHLARVQVWPDAEERLREPILLQPPSTLTVTLHPPLHPAGKPWQVGLISVAGQQGRVVARDEPVSRDGEWTRKGLPAGPYRLLVRGPSGDVWHQASLELQPGSDHVALDLRMLHLTGTVSLGDEPMAARVTLVTSGAAARLGEQAGGVRISFDSDQNGKFEGLIPRMEDRDWAALVDSADPHIRVSVDRVLIEKVGDSSAEVTIRLAGASIEGTVVDEAGAPVTGSALVFAHTLDDQSNLGCTVQARVSAKDHGQFRLKGLAPGDYRVNAEALDQQSEEVTVRAKEGTQPEKVRLVLRRASAVAGQVVGPDGSPIPGAEIVAWAADSPFGGVRPVRSDAQGGFTLPVPAGARQIMITASAPGFVRRVFRQGLPATGDLLLVKLDVIGGTLVLLGLPDPNDRGSAGTYVTHDGAIEGLNSLAQWSALNGESPGPDGLRVPQMQAGAYRVCRAASDEYDAFVSGTLPGNRCTDGYLPYGGELTLVVPSVAGVSSARKQ